MGIAGGKQEEDDEENEESRQSLAVFKIHQITVMGVAGESTSGRMVFKHVAPPPDADAKSQLLAAITVTEKTLKRYYQNSTSDVNLEICLLDKNRDRELLFHICCEKACTTATVGHENFKCSGRAKFWACKSFIKKR